jgi:ABC-type branched-subunit amino acid transport system ATPase component/ABC-type branched-subunit amino acid transport system permease subunit
MRARTWSLTGSAILAVVLLAAPVVTGTGTYQLGQSEYVLSMVLVAIGFNIATGYAGQLTLGPGATFLTAAYACAVFANELPGHASLWLMGLIGIAAAVLLGLLMAMPALRVGGFYLAIVTLFMALVLPEVFTNVSWAGGQQGISLVSNLDFVQNITGLGLYEICAAVVLVTVFATWIMLKSKLGRRLLALRTGDQLTASVGVRTYSSKIMAFCISSIPAGLGGALYVYSQQFVSPTSADASTSIYLVAACILGGLGTLWGPVIGTILLLEVQLHLGGLQEYLSIVFGAILLLCTLAFPRGLVGLASRLIPQAARKPSTAPFGAPAADDRAQPHPDRGADALVVSDIACRYGGVTALDGVSLRVMPGTVHALIGSNGSGKTTLLNAISGFTRAQAGTVVLGPTGLHGSAPAKIARLGISRTFQTPKLMTSETVLDNVILAADASTPGTALESMLRLPRGRSSDARAKKAALQALRDLGLLETASVLAESVPHGSMRLIEVARCIAAGPRVVLLDEPAAGLTAKELAALRDSIRRTASQGVGVLLVEHNTSFVFDIADEVTVLHQGRVIASGTPADIVTHEEVIAAYLGNGPATRRAIERSATGARGRAGARDGLGHDGMVREGIAATEAE